MNIPARYCTGYLGRHRRRCPSDAPTDFTAWIEVYLGGKLARLRSRATMSPRIGRIAMTKALDGAHTPLTTSFGNATLMNFVVRAQQVD